MDSTLKRVEEDIRNMKSEMSAIREEHSDLKSRVAVLEESRKTIEAQTRAIIAETVADLRIKFAESQLAAQQTAPGALLQGERKQI